MGEWFKIDYIGISGYFFSLRFSSTNRSHVGRALHYVLHQTLHHALRRISHILETRSSSCVLNLTHFLKHLLHVFLQLLVVTAPHTVTLVAITRMVSTAWRHPTSTVAAMMSPATAAPMPHRTSPGNTVMSTSVITRPGGSLSTFCLYITTWLDWKLTTGQRLFWQIIAFHEACIAWY